MNPQAAEKLGIAQQVEFHGGIAKRDVPKWLDRADIFLNTSRIDNTPVTVAEAMACGLCVVSTDVGGMPYMLRDGVDGLLCPDDAVEPMAKSITRLLREKKTAEKISDEARRQAFQQDWSKVIPIWSELLKGAAHRDVP